jgi:prepilin-type N-terminal cleavage/methylation domain-containing protein
MNGNEFIGMQRAVYRAILRQPARGYTLIEVMFALTVAAILAAIAIPQTMTTVDRSRAWAAARYLAGRMALARMQAVGGSATVALRFAEGTGTFAFDTFVDGNRDGVRTRDIASGVDRPLDRPVQLSEMFPGVAIGTGDGDDPVRIGTSSLLSFTPVGTATSGTIYIRGRDGSRFAVRVLGATGRTRVLRYVPRTGAWAEVL